MTDSGRRTNYIKCLVSSCLEKCVFFLNFYLGGGGLQLKVFPLPRGGHPPAGV